MKNDFKVKLMTTDGSLIVDRRSDSDFYLNHHNELDVTNAEMVLTSNAREKGVRILSYSLNKDKQGITAVVDWF